MTSPEGTKFCLESNFIIDLLNGKENAVKVFEEIKNSRLTVTSIASMALFEILRGQEKNQEKVNKFEELRKKLVVLPFGEREAIEASEIEKAQKDKGAAIHSIDIMIGATAKTNGAILISNDKYYQTIQIEGLKLRTY
ncbi:MAG: type II toxin-antitoxin system VapC family toxin [Patescibacteria group bacterium]